MKSTTAAATTTLLALAAAAPQGAPASVTSDWESYATAHGAPTNIGAYSSLGGEFSSWTSEASLTAWPTATSEWASITSAHPLPSELSSVASSWQTLTTGAPNGWGAGVWGGNNGNSTNSTASGWSGANGHGPFGGAANGWGNWASESNSAWTSGPWTSWWGTNGCPDSTWSGKHIHCTAQSSSIMLTSFQAGHQQPTSHGRPGQVVLPPRLLPP